MRIHRQTLQYYSVFHLINRYFVDGNDGMSSNNNAVTCICLFCVTMVARRRCSFRRAYYLFVGSVPAGQMFFVGEFKGFLPSRVTREIEI